MRDWEDGETRIGYVQRNEKGVIKEVGVVGVGDLNYRNKIKERKD